MAPVYYNGVDVTKSYLGSGTAFIGIPTLDADAQSFLTATGITDPTIRSAINGLVVNMKEQSLWTKMQAIYPFVGGTATTNKFNLKNPADTNAAFRLSFVGGWTHDSSGATPNGTTGWADTFYVPSTHMASATSTHLSMYLGTNIAATSADPVDFGSLNSIIQALLVLSRATYLTRNLGDLVESAAQDTRAGYFVTTRDGSTTATIYKNGTSGGSGTSTGTLPTVALTLGNLRIGNGTMYNEGWTKNRFQLATIGSGLSATDASNLNTIVQNFQTTLGRAV
jgi:hypothetical protein